MEGLLEHWPEVGAWLVDYCSYGTPWHKRTKFFSNTILKDPKTLCRGCAKHLLLKSRSKRHKASWTQVAQAYPEGVANALARALLQKTLFCEEGRCFDPASCAIAGSGRIGEASHPGPRRPRGELRTGLLADVPLVEP